MSSTKVILVPLDERPVNTKYPEMIAKVAGAQILLPPAEIRGHQRVPSDRDAVVKWLRSAAQDCSAAIVSCDFLGYGNLINARISDESAIDVLSRMNVLAELPAPVHAFSLITRVSNADDNTEEPLYWKEWGTKFYAYSALAHRAMTGNELTQGERRTTALLTMSFPEELKSDWLLRRLRNHTVNLALVDLVGRKKIESLLLTSDDTSIWGFPSRERTWLKSWNVLIPAVNERLSMHPGADEVGSALVAKLINVANGHRPSVWIDYAIDEDSARIAPYEDRPVSETVKGQIAACGAEMARTAAFADLILGVLTPSPNGKDYQPGYLTTDRTTRTKPYKQLFERLAKAQKSGTPVMLADVAYPNGADPLVMELLRRPDSPLSLGHLAAYGAWNTAGNTLGVVVAQGVCSLYIGGDPERTLAQKTFLTHRFLEDWGYQTVVRREARKYALENWHHHDPNPDSKEEVGLICKFIEQRLTILLSELQAVGIGNGLELIPYSTRLPWKRTFEVDFELQSIK